MSPDRQPPVAEPRRSRCLYRREGRYWWRVDADITQGGALVVTSGDASEWQVIVEAGEVSVLLAALRRADGAVVDSDVDAEDELLSRLEAQFASSGSSGLESIKTYLLAQRIPFEVRFWAGGRDD